MVLWGRAVLFERGTSIAGPGRGADRLVLEVARVLQVLEDPVAHVHFWVGVREVSAGSRAAKSASTSSHTMYLLISLIKSTPPQNRQLNIVFSNT